MRIEIQIRTRRCTPKPSSGWPRTGPTSRATRRRGGAQSIRWIRDLLEILEHAASAEELLEHTRMAMFQDQVFAFTPKGELIQLPAGSTPVDFAYAVHTIARRQLRRRQDQRPHVPLRTTLDNGDQVEILALQSRQHPQPAWLSFVVTGKARSAVRRHVRNLQRDAQLAMGRKLFDEIVARLKRPLDEAAITEALAPAQARRPQRAVCRAGAADADRRGAARGSAARVDRRAQQGRQARQQGRWRARRPAGGDFE